MPADDTTRDRELAELAALADGSLPAERRAALERAVAASPRLQALLREQREALDAVRSLDDRAPAHVRESIATTVATPAARNRRRRLAAGAGAIAAAVATVVLLALPGSEPAAPTLSEAAAIADRQPASRALSEGETAWGIEFPELERFGGWSDAGSRIDRVGNRAARTVYYVNGGRRIAYTILSIGPVRVPAGTRSWERHGKPWYAFRQRGRTVVAWERKGHMCVVSASGLNGRGLVRLITR
jgi:anti-sigma factor RsiW